MGRLGIFGIYLGNSDKETFLRERKYKYIYWLLSAEDSTRIFQGSSSQGEILRQTR